MITNPDHVLLAGTFDLRGGEIGTTGCTVTAVAADATFGNPKAVETTLTSQMRDGTLVRDGKFENREPSFRLIFEAADSVSIAQGVAAFWRWCADPTTLTWQHPDGFGVETTYTVLRASLEHEFDDMDQLHLRELHTFSMVCLPFGESPTETTSATMDADGSVQEVDIKGSARANATIEVFSDIGDGIGEVVVYAHPALSSGYDPMPAVTMTGAGSDEVLLTVPLAGLPRGGYTLMGPHLTDEVFVSTTVQSHPARPDQQRPRQPGDPREPHPA